jgi:hypothetical protein
MDVVEYLNIHRRVPSDSKINRKHILVGDEIYSIG